MPKLKSTPITSQDLEAYIAAEDDFGFEIACLHALKQFPSLELDHAGTYTDPVTEKHRQFDFRVRFTPHANLRIAAAIECKNLRANYPLHISRLPRLPEEGYHDLLIRDKKSISTNPVVLHASKSQRMAAPDSPYAVGEMVGKSTVQVGIGLNCDFHSDDSEVYEKWAQAVSSIYDLIGEANYHFYSNPDADVDFFFACVVVVPDHMLWVKDYQLDGTAVGPTVQTDETTLYLDHEAQKTGRAFVHRISHLHFVTQSGLVAFIHRHLSNQDYLKLLAPLG